MIMILYLDIDGVLNDNTQESIRNRYGYPTETAYAEFCKFRPKEENIFQTHLHQLDIALCLKFLGLCKRLLSKGILKGSPEGMDIVICSTWRKVFSVEQLKYLFYLKGFPEIAQNIKRHIVEFKEGDWVKTEKVREYINSENLKQADLDILYDLYQNDVGLEDYYILSDDVSHLKNNLFKAFKESNGF